MIIKHLTKKYAQGHETITAIDDMNLSFPKKGLVCIYGKSGSGKSTLIHLLSGIEKPDSGNVDFENIDITSLSKHELDLYRSSQVSLVFQDYNLIDTITVYDNLSIAMILSGQQEDSNIISEILSQVDLVGYEKRFPNTLSGGQMQRVAIARALIKNAPVVLADEPTGALDSESSFMIWKLIKRLSKDRLFIIATHDMDAIRQFSDHIVELDSGRVIRNSINFEQSCSDNLTMKKGQLSLKLIRHIGLRQIFKLKIKFLTTLFISTLSLILFGLTFSISNYELDANAYRAMKIYNDSIVVGKFMNSDDSLSPYRTTSYDEINRLPGNSIPIFEHFPPNYRFINPPNNITFIHDARSSISITQEDLSNLGWTISAGRLPQTDDEIAITLHVYDILRNNPFLDLTSNAVIINSTSDVLGQVFEISDSLFTVVGIVDTEFDSSRYTEVDFNQNTIETLQLSIELQSIITSEVHQLTFYSQSYYENIFSKYYVKQNRLPQMMNLGFGSSLPSFQSYLILQKSYFPFNSVEIISNYDRDLNANEILLPFSMLETHHLFGDQIIQDLNDMIDIFVESHYPAIQADYENIENIPYKIYIMTHTVNAYHPGYDYNYFRIEAIKNFIDTHYDSISTIKVNVSDLVFGNREYALYGFYDDSTLSLNNGIVFSDNIYNELVMQYDIQYYLGALMNVNSNQQLSTLNSINSLDLLNPIYQTNTHFNNQLQNLSSIGFIVSMVILLISLFLCYQYITNNIMIMRKNIGILRSLGSSFIDILKIFALQSGFVCFISYIMSLLAIIFSFDLINYVLFKYYDFRFILFIFNWNLVFILAILNFIIIFITTILPTLIYYHRHPMDTLRK